MTPHAAQTAPVEASTTIAAKNLRQARVERRVGLSWVSGTSVTDLAHGAEA
jgi:hypothetical protein